MSRRLRQQHTAAAAGRTGQIPGGPLLPAQYLHDHRAAAQGPQGGYRRPGVDLPGELLRAVRNRQGIRSRRRLQSLPLTTARQCRELENLIHRTVIGVRGHVITGDDIEGMLNENLYEDLVINLKRGMRTSASLDFNKIIEQQEIQLIGYALKKFGSTRKAAEFLNMTQPQLMRKKQKYNI
jgi:hypothetical protein